MKNCSLTKRALIIPYMVITIFSPYIVLIIVLTIISDVLRESSYWLDELIRKMAGR